MGIVILQTYDSVDTIKAEAQEKFGENCEFDKYLGEMRLRPISFISRSTVSPLKNSLHNF